MTIVDIVSIEDDVTASDVIVEKNKLLSDDWGVRLFGSVEKTW